MSDLLSGLRDPGAEAIGLGGYVHKDDVREALRNPTDEQVEALIEVAAAHGNFGRMIRAVLAAAAGGDDGE